LEGYFANVAQNVAQNQKEVAAFAATP